MNQMLPDAFCYASLIGFQPDEELVDMTGSKAGGSTLILAHST